jgi:hypothetical protein
MLIGRGTVLAIAAAVALSAVALAKAEQAKPTNYKGLEITALGIERAKNVALIDCPPGQNSVRGNALEGMEFAVVTLAFKVTPAFDAKTIVKKPVLTDAAGKTFQTSVSIIDAGSVPEYKCSFPFRVPSGTKVASVTIDTATITVTDK